MDAAGQGGSGSGSAARDGPPPRRRHQPKRRSPAPGTESPMPRWHCPDGTLIPARHKIQASGKGTGSAGSDSGNWRVLLSFIPAGAHRQVPPGSVPARHSDGRHPAPVSRRRGRTPEAERSPIGLSCAYVRAGPPGRDPRGGREFPDVGVGRSRGWPVPWERSRCCPQPVLVGLV